MKEASSYHHKTALTTNDRHQLLPPPPPPLPPPPPPRAPQISSKPIETEEPSTRSALLAPQSPTRSQPGTNPLPYRHYDRHHHHQYHHHHHPTIANTTAATAVIPVLAANAVFTVDIAHPAKLGFTQRQLRYLPRFRYTLRFSPLAFTTTDTLLSFNISLYRIPSWKSFTINL